MEGKDLKTRCTSCSFTLKDDQVEVAKIKMEQGIKNSFHRRELPSHLVAFESQEGRKIFREALSEGFMECYFPLASQFHTQSEPAYCGLGTLTMVLNSLSIDPQRTWKGVWRWFAEDLLSCCTPLEVIKQKGITFAQFNCLARCNGAKLDSYYGTEITEEFFREKVKHCASMENDDVLVISYDRSVLKQTGTGHFSPMGGYCAQRDLVLILDVARFKYPSHWVPLSQVYQSLMSKDPETGRSRGISILSKGGALGALCRVTIDEGERQAVIRELREGFPKTLRDDPPSSVIDLIQRCAAFPQRFELDLLPDVNGIESLQLELESHPLFRVMKEALPGDTQRKQKLITILLLAYPQELLEPALPSLVWEEFKQLRAMDGFTLLKREVLFLQETFSTIKEFLKSEC